MCSSSLHCSGNYGVLTPNSTNIETKTVPISMWVPDHKLINVLSVLLAFVAYGVRPLLGAMLGKTSRTGQVKAQRELSEIHPWFQKYLQDRSGTPRTLHLTVCFLNPDPQGVLLKPCAMSCLIDIRYRRLEDISVSEQLLLGNLLPYNVIHRDRGSICS